MANRSSGRQRGRRPGYISRARWTAFFLIVFMLWFAVVPLYPSLANSIDPTGWWTAYIAKKLVYLLLLYLAIEMDETSRRNSTNQEGFVIDNGLAFIGVLIGFATLVLWAFRPGYKLTADQFNIVTQCTLTVAIDFAFGLIFSQRIAFAGKERAETEEGRS
jgi:hypothetical protein